MLSRFKSTWGTILRFLESTERVALGDADNLSSRVGRPMDRPAGERHATGMLLS
jgi:hypothetical protein